MLIGCVELKYLNGLGDGRMHALIWRTGKDHSYAVFGLGGFAFLEAGISGKKASKLQYLHRHWHLALGPFDLASME